MGKTVPYISMLLPYFNVNMKKIYKYAELIRVSSMEWKNY